MRLQVSKSAANLKIKIAKEPFRKASPPAAGIDRLQACPVWDESGMRAKVHLRRVAAHPI
jgi:hypothetical protein